jgi:hypothetical protein
MLCVVFEPSIHSSHGNAKSFKKYLIQRNTLRSVVGLN